jgi:hypothetical protein
VPKPSTTQKHGGDSLRRMELQLDGFALEALEQEAGRLGVPAEEVVAFALLYYLADLDSGRIAREISMSPFGQQLAHPS